MQRDSGAKNKVLPGFRDAGTQNHVQKPSAGAKAGKIRRGHINGFKLHTQTLEGSMRRDEMIGFSFRKLSLMAE